MQLPQPVPSVSVAPETTTLGSLALAAEADESDQIDPSEPPAESVLEIGPQIVPPILPPTPPSPPVAASSADGPEVEAIRSAVVQALAAGGHQTAATLIEDGKWNVEGSAVRIEVNSRPKMISLTFNAAAEKLIRQGLTQAGAPTRFMIVPGDGLASAGGAAKVRAPLGSIENEARNHPLVVQAQALFNAEIVTVVDLR
jgi:DNA polymerase-3 subunit gamma/tau